MSFQSDSSTAGSLPEVPQIVVWKSEAIEGEKISKWPSNEFVLVSSVSLENMRSPSPVEEKMPSATTQYVRERLSPRTRSLESLSEVSCDVEKESEVETAASVVALLAEKTAVTVNKKLTPLRNAPHFGNRPKRAQGFSNLTVLVEDEENDAEPAKEADARLLPPPSNGMQRSVSADLHPRKE